MKESLIKMDSTPRNENKYSLCYKREFKFMFKKKNFKFKYFKTLIQAFYLFKFFNKSSRYIKNNVLKVKSKFLIKKYIYFNYITDGIDIKYSDQIQQNLDNKYVFVKNFLKKNIIYSRVDRLNILKLQQIIILFNNKYTINNLNYIYSQENDYFLIINLIYIFILISFNNLNNYFVIIKN